MRTSKIAAVVALLAGLVWIVAGVLAWDGDGLVNSSELLWWVGVGLFVLASALAGYAGATRSPVWLQAIVFLGAGALGGSVVSLVDTDAANADVVAVIAGGATVLVGLVGLLLGRGRGAPEEPERPVHGRRAAR